jgi:hypothetical protein
MSVFSDMMSSESQMTTGEDGNHTNYANDSESCNGEDQFFASSS